MKRKEIKIGKQIQLQVLMWSAGWSIKEEGLLCIQRIQRLWDNRGSIERCKREQHNSLKGEIAASEALTRRSSDLRTDGIAKF